MKKMRQRFLVLIFLGCSTLWANPDIVIGLSPNEAVPKVKELENELTKRLNEKVTLYVGKNYEDLASAFQKGTLQGAILPPRLAVKLEKSTSVRYLLKKVYNNSEYYYSAIVTLANSPFKSLASLNNKRIGYVDKESASGFLYPQLLLSAALPRGKFQESFWGTHEKALEALAQGKVDAVGVWAEDPTSQRGAWTKFAENLPKKVKLKPLAFSEPIPNDPLIVREDFYKAYPAKVLRLMEVLLALSEESPLIKEVTGADRLTTATRMHFASVRALEAKAQASSSSDPQTATKK